MEAICAIVNFDGRPGEEVRIRRMNEAALFFGNTAEDCFVAESVGLGYRETLRAGQVGPTRGIFVDADANCYVTFEGKLDNREALGRQLNLKDVGKATDPTIILHAYLKWGVACVNRFFGSFVFGVFDRNKRRLFCGRDAIGLKQLFYHQNGDRIILASQLRQVLADQSQPPPFADEFFGYYLLNGIPPIVETPFRGIKKLPAGHTLTIENGTTKVERYWRPEDIPVLHFPDHRDYAAGFAELFRDAVAANLVSTGPVWAELSGGLDSSSIVCMAQEVLRQNWRPALRVPGP